MTTPTLGLDLINAADTLATALITKMNTNLQDIDTAIAAKISQGSVLTNIIVSTTAAGTNPLIVKGILGQTAHLLDARDNVDATKAFIGATGRISTVESVLVGPAANTIGIGSLRVSPPHNAEQAVVIRGVASQVANLLEVQNSSGTTLSALNSDGSFIIGNSFIRNGFDPEGQFQSSAAARRALIIKGFAGQTANLLEVQNSSGTVKSAFEADGRLTTHTAFITAETTGSQVLRLRGLAGQTANLFEAQNSSGTFLSGFGGNGWPRYSAGVVGGTAVGAYYGYQSVHVEGVGDKKIQLFN